MCCEWRAGVREDNAQRSAKERRMKNGTERKWEAGREGCHITIGKCGLVSKGGSAKGSEATTREHVRLSDTVPAAAQRTTRIR